MALGYDTPWYMVILLGMGIVFVGLGLLILLCSVLRLLLSDKKVEPASQLPAAQQENDVIPDKKRLIAAITAAIAEAEGTDIRALRVVSFKRRKLS